MHKLFIWALLLYTAPIVAEGPSVPSGYKKVFERLGTTNKGTEYQLTEAPSNQFPVHIFRDGLELAPGTDYEVDGNAVHMYRDEPSGKSSIYQAAYYVPAQILSTSRTTAVDGGFTSASKRVLEAYLSRSLRSELGLSSTEHDSGTHRAVRTLPSLSAQLEGDKPEFTRAAREEIDPEPASFRMLDSIMAERESQSRRLRTKRSKTPDAATAQGLEGVGDVFVSSPFDHLSYRGVDSAAQASGNTSASKKSAPEPASSRMLRQTRRRGL